MIRTYGLFVVWALILIGTVSATLNTDFSSSAGSSTLNIDTMMQRDDLTSILKFGRAANETAYMYDASATTLVTLGDTKVRYIDDVDTSTTQNYAAEFAVQSTGYINAESTVGMLAVNSNIPTSPCDPVGQVPSYQSVDGRVGAMIGNGSFKTEIGLDDATVHLKGTAGSQSGTLYGNMIAESIEGFDMNSSEPNAQYFAHVDAISRADYDKGMGSELTFDWSDATTDYAQLIDTLNEELPVPSGMSENRLDEYVNDTENMSVNQTVNISATTAE